MGSDLPEHRIDGHNQFTQAGYVGGGFHDVMDEKEKKDRADYNNPTFKPFTDNLADYLEGYKGQVNKSGFPRMDHTSLRWYVQYLKRCHPHYLDKENSRPMSIAIKSALRNEE